MISNNEYVPKVGPESTVYEGLWKVASPSGADLSGKDAVEFFRKSGVDIGFLKQVSWQWFKENVTDIKFKIIIPFK